MPEQWRKGIVTKIVNETAHTRRFWITIPELTAFNFKPGQFVTLDLPIHEKPNKRWRSYSIASWPDGTNTIELVIVLLPGGLGTEYLFNAVTEGSELTLRGPQGVFVLPENLDKDLFFICTGTGIAPFRSMLHHIKLLQLPHKNLYLIFGTRTLADTLYYHEMQALEKELNNFYFLPVFSRESEDNTAVKKGYVHQVYEPLISQLPPAYFYLCGWKNMIEDAKEKLLAIGYTKKEIHFELYG